MPWLTLPASLEPFSPQEVVAWLGIRLDGFPAWACAHLESELASITDEEPARWCARSTTASSN